MPRLASRIPALALGLAAVCASGTAQEAGVTTRLHPWGQFEPGAWKTDRVVTETLNEQGQVVSTSTTDTKFTLVDIDKDGVTLEIQACIEVAGKRFRAEPQSIKKGVFGEPFAPNLKLKEPVDGQVTIEDQKIPCKVQQLESAGPNSKTVTTVYYSPTVAPYILKRDSVTTNAESKSETSVEVIALNMPRKFQVGRFQGETKIGAYVKTVQKNEKSTVLTVAFVLPEVPGGIVDYSSKEVDRNDRLVRQTTLELIDCNSDPDQDRTGIFGRRRVFRNLKKATPRQ